MSGYGVPGETFQMTRRRESRTLAQMQANAPRILQARGAKPVVNTELLERVFDLQRSKGVEDGFCQLMLHEIIFGEQPDFLAQLIGSCVASSHMRGVTLRTNSEIFLLNDSEQLLGREMTGRDNLQCFAPFSYRGGRSLADINGGRTNGRDDGSLVSRHAESATTLGMLLCSAQDLESDVFPEPTEELYRIWGADDRMINQFRDDPKRIIQLEAEPVHTVEAARRALLDFKPIHVGSSAAFMPYAQTNLLGDNGQKVREYVIDPNDSWQHAMVLVSALKVGGRWFYKVLNSWGKIYDGQSPWFIISQQTLNQWIHPQFGATMITIGELDLLDNTPAF